MGYRRTPNGYGSVDILFGPKARGPAVERTIWGNAWNSLLPHKEGRARPMAARFHVFVHSHDKTDHSADADEASAGATVGFVSSRLRQPQNGSS